MAARAERMDGCQGGMVMAVIHRPVFRYPSFQGLVYVVALDGGFPMSRVNFKKWPCLLFLYLTCQLWNSPIKFLKMPYIMSIIFSSVSIGFMSPADFGK